MDNALWSRFWGFDKLIGSLLVKIIYYLGLAVLAIALLVGLTGALSKLRYNAAEGLGTFLGVLLGTAMLVVTWRFFCELAILAFQTYNRLGEIRDRLPPPHADTP